MEQKVSGSVIRGKSSAFGKNSPTSRKSLLHRFFRTPESCSTFALKNTICGPL